MDATFGEVVERLRRATVAVQTQRGSGGSSVIWSADGRIVTNAHVVEGAGHSGAIEVQLWDGRRTPATIAHKDRRRDLASLQIEAKHLAAATPGDSNALRPGELVIAVGNPLGFIGAASTGIVHRIENRSWVVSQLRLAPGNSGGPLANASGEVVGINTMITRGGAGGLAFAVSSHSVMQFLNSRDAARSGANDGLGVVVRPIAAGVQGRELGLIVLEVVSRSPAERASILQGDILVGANGNRFRALQDLELAIEASRGATLQLEFHRGGNANVRSVVVQMATRSVMAA